MTTSARREIPESQRLAARVAATAFGGSPRVQRYYDEPGEYRVDLLTCDERPTPGFSTYSTVSLHQSKDLLEQSDIRVEMAGVASTNLTEFPNMIASAAFNVIKDGWLAAPGVVFPSLVRRYGLSATLEHVLWVEPFPWDQLGSVELGGALSAHWLLGIPISESERQFLLDRGFDVFEALFEDRRVEYFDLSRKPVV
jgi:hypothetical protein